MEKDPSVKFLLFAILFSVITFFSVTNGAWAYLQDVAKEYRFKAEQLQSEGKLDQAIKYYQKAIEIDKHNAAAFNGLAICYERKGWFKQAEDEYLQALEVDPRYAPAHYNLGLLYEKRVDLEKAVFHWKQRIRLGHPADPGRIKARLKLQRYAPEQLEEEAAKELSHQLVEEKEQESLDRILGRNKYMTKEEKIQDYYLEGMQLFQKGDFRKTAECFQKMIEALPFSQQPVK
ncbi:MAG: tetratricopeptide repeat protein [Candidatus Omnitrophica bacterium]|nr:tetratricopeptide repeat protein [Candidatus Omnitrophota bacterium]